MHKVLVIDDEPTVCAAVAIMLRMKGVEVEEACDGQQGLEQARRNPPDLILSDLSMPVLDGFKTLEHVRADPILRSIPFIVITGIPSEAAEQRLERGGANGMLAKPFTIDQLWEAVKVHLPAPAAGPPAS